MNQQEPPDDVAILQFARAIAADDAEYFYWPKEGVDHALWLWQQALGRVPHPGTIYSNLGIERGDRLHKLILERRKLFNQLTAYKSACHYCGASEKIETFDFGMMNVKATSRNWVQAATSATISAVTVPLLGAGFLQLPSKSLTGATLHLRLAICPSCKKDNSNFFGLFLLKEKHAARHPLWDAVRQAGFEKFLESDQMPFGLKTRFGQEDL